MKRSELHPMPMYFDRYIHLTDDVELFEALQISFQELEHAPVDKWKALGDKVYAPDKWTIKDLLQHLIDTERIFGYRVLAFSRKEPQKMLGFDEVLYAKNANANHRTIDELYDELKIVRLSFIQLYKSFTNEMLHTIGKGSTTEYSVISMGFMIAGHQRWHFKVVEEKYFPLLKSN